MHVEVPLPGGRCHLQRGLNQTCCHFVSLDQVIGTMRDTGADMQAKYKETSRGGLAVHAGEAVRLGVHLPEC